MTLRSTELKLNQGVGRSLVKLAILVIARTTIKNKNNLPESEVFLAKRILDNPDWYQERIYPLIVDDIEEDTDDSTIILKVKEALSLFEV